MKTWTGFDPNANEYMINTRIPAHEVCQMTAFMRSKVYERAEKLLAKLLIRSIIRRRKIDDLADSIDFNAILANSFKVSIKEL